MVSVIANRVKEQCSGAGLANLTLTGPFSGYRAFSDAVSVGSIVPYVVMDGIEWEAGWGTLVSATELSRDEIVDSSQTSTLVNSGAPGTPVKLSLGAGQHTVILDVNAQNLFFMDKDGGIANPGGIRRSVTVTTFAALAALGSLTTNDTVLVLGGASVGDGKGGVFRWDGADSNNGDNVDTIESSEYPSGLWKRTTLDMIAGPEDKWLLKTASFACVAGENYLVDTTTGVLTATLPATPATGDWVRFTDRAVAGSWRTNNLTVDRNGQTISGAASNVVEKGIPRDLTFIFNGATWLVLRGPASGESVAVVTATATIDALGQTIPANTTGGAFTLNLPPAPADNARVAFFDIAGKWDEFPLTIGRNGNSILGAAEDLLCNVKDAFVRLEYTGATFGWRLIP